MIFAADQPMSRTFGQGAPERLEVLTLMYRAQIGVPARGRIATATTATTTTATTTFFDLPRPDTQGMRPW